MQNVPYTKRLVAQTIQSTAGRRLIAAAVGLAVAGTATLVLSSPDSAKRQADAMKRYRPRQRKTAGVTVSLIHR